MSSCSPINKPSAPGSSVPLFQLQLCVLGFGFFQDGNAGVGIFPEGEEIPVGGECPRAGEVGIRSLRGFRLQGVGTSHSKMGQGSRPVVPDDAAVVDDLLKLGGGSVALSGRQGCLSMYVHRIEAGNIVEELNCRQLDGGSSRQGSEGSSR